MLWRKALKDLAVRRVRTALTVLGILIGVAGLVAIITSAQGFARAQQQAFATGQRADLAIYLYDAPLPFLRAVERIPGVRVAELRFNQFGRGRLGERETLQEIRFIGLRDVAGTPIEAPILIAGEYPERDEVLIESAAAANYALAIGDTLSYFDINNRERPLRISGFARLPATLSADLTGLPLAFINDSTARTMREVAGYNEMLVRFDGTRPPRQVGDAIVALLSERRIPRAEPRYSDPNNYVGKRELDTLFVVLYLFGGLGVVLSGFIVANTLAALVAESVQEIGILKAMGATRRQVLSVFLAMAGILGGVGTLLGIAVGTLLGYLLLLLLGRVAQLEPAFQLEPAAIGLGAVVGIGVTLIGGMIPAWQAANLTPKAALESRGVSQNFGRSRLDRLVQRFATLPPLPAMAIRNLLRRKTRSAVTMVVVALAVASLLAAQATDTSVAGALDDVLATYRADGYLQFGAGATRLTTGDLRRVAGVESAEAWLLRSCTANLTRTRCWAFPPDTLSYTPNLVAGEWLLPSDPLGVVITQDVATANDWTVGDRFPLRYQRREKWVTVRGITVDNAIFLGSDIQSKVFVAYDTFAGLVGQSTAADVFAVSLAPSTRVEQQAVLDGIRQKLGNLRPSGTLALTEFETTKQQTDILSATLRGMVILVALIGATGLLNTLALTIIERRREIGVLRALGTDNLQMVAIFMTEGLGLGIVGWVVGLGMGYTLARLFVGALASTLFEFTFRFPPDLIGLSLLFALALALVASIAPALAAANLKTIEAIRYE
jgi:putative ABC transport system permease protein